MFSHKLQQQHIQKLEEASGEVLPPLPPRKSIYNQLSSTSTTGVSVNLPTVSTNNVNLLFKCLF